MFQFVKGSLKSVKISEFEIATYTHIPSFNHECQESVAGFLNILYK